MSLLRENEDHWVAIESQISLPMLGRRTDVRVVRVIKCCDGGIGCLCLVVLRFVVQKSDLKMILIRCLLQQGEIVIGKRSACTVPVHNERRDAHVLRLLNLPPQHRRIVAGISHIDMDTIAKPRHVHRKKLWPGTRSLRILSQGALYARSGTSCTYHETYNRNT